MSVGSDGKYLCCDGEGCQTSALAPVGLRSFFPEDAGTAPSAKGWLFVHENGRIRHFCPRCAPHYLSALAGSEQQRQEKDEQKI